MQKEKIRCPIGGLIINNIYSGYYERVFYAGMPSKDSFSLIYKTAYVRENPDCHSVVPHACDESIETVQDYEQLFFPIDTKEVEFLSRRLCKFEIKKVSPTSLTALVEHD